MGIKLSNNAFGTLAAGINSSATSITLTTGQGARFPSLGAGDFFYATLIDTSNNLEIVKCTARSTDVLTVVRAQESTTARAYVTGDRIEIRLTAQTFIDAVNEIGPTQVSDEANTSTGSFSLPKGTTAQRPGTPTAGMQRMNSTTNYMEYYDGSVWNPIAVPYSVDFLIVAGGGAGGGNLAGGGGGGGVIANSVSVTPTVAYGITVGAGGSGVVATQGGVTGGSGTSSVFNNNTAIGGGGGGGGQNPAPASSGGSGGGGSGYSGSAPGGAGTSGQGYAGGASGLGSPNYPGGGGGGAAAVGQTPASSSSAGGNGGAGVLSAINGSSLYWAGGGGGGGYVGGNGAGSGGIGGGGGGGCDTGTAGTGGGSALNSGGNGRSYSATGLLPNGGAGGTNTGGGGGGTGHNVSPGWGTSGNGGSGIVIIRYLGSQKGSGGTVTSSGGYTIHTFTSSGTFTA